jgi:3-hydroxyisobutyrate dehydrogenase
MESILINGIANNLATLEKDCWFRLENGALQTRDEMHTAVVANSGSAGISMRTIILRNAFPVEKQLCFYTDTRSGKWAELQQQNQISWLFYDSKDRIQIRVGGIASLHQNNMLADQNWNSTTILNRKNYLSVLSPSAITELPESGLPAGQKLVKLTAAESEAGRKNFGVVLTKIKWMDWLWLNNDGHRRANFVYQEDGGFTANWLTP